MHTARGTARRGPLMRMLRLGGLALLLPGGEAIAQELTPRAYWPTPVGTNLVAFGYQRNTGDIVVDPSLPVTGVDSDIDYLQLSYQRAIDALGRSASVQLSLPWADGDTRGDVDGEFARRRTTGLGDLRLRFALNLFGARAMDVRGLSMLRQAPRPIIGASVIVQAPTGDYDPDRVVNLGTNRWAVKPAIGAIVPLRRTWLFEAEVGVWMFEDNDDFVGQTREQDRIVSVEAHVVKRIRPGFWASLDANYYGGGETRIDGEPPQALQRNARVGATAVFPLRGRSAVRASYSTGVATRSGGDFDILALSFAYAW